MTPAVFVPKMDLLDLAKSQDNKQYTSKVDSAPIKVDSGKYAILRITANTAAPVIARGERICIHAFLRNILANLPCLLENQNFLFLANNRIRP